MECIIMVMQTHNSTLMNDIPKKQKKTLGDDRIQWIYLYPLEPFQGHWTPNNPSWVPSVVSFII